MVKFLELENRMILRLKIKPLSPLLIKLGDNEETAGNRAFFTTTESPSGLEIKMYKSGDKKGEIEKETRVGEIYIPGSTLKGLFRDRFFEMYKDENLENELFGMTVRNSETGNKDNNEKSRKSRFFAQDAYFYQDSKRCIFYENDKCKNEKGPIEEFIKTRAITPIDHFSSKVVAPLNFEYTKEDFLTEIIVNNIKEKEIQGLLFIIRDSINKEIRIGNSKTRGFGLVEFEIDDLRIEKYGNNKKYIDIDRFEKYFEINEGESIKLGDKYLRKSLHLKDKKVDVNAPSEFIKALFGEVK